MILRRVIEHVKAQNWTAVTLDFVIVVVGVFMGIQLGNWNEARRESDIEALYLERLKSEISDLSAIAADDHKIVEDRYALLVAVRDYFETGNGLESLTGDHCGAVARSHIYAGSIFNPPTIRELIDTGRILVIRNEDLRSSILAYEQAIEEAVQLRTDIQIDRLPLARKYPELVTNGLSSWGDSQCEFAAMRKSSAFMNDFTDNRRRMNAYESQVAGRQVDLLEALAAKLEVKQQMLPTADNTDPGHVPPPD